MHDLRRRVEHELRSDILPFWMQYAIDEEFGGFRGQIANDLTIDPFAHKGLILNARILWTFSKAFRYYREPVHLEVARRAYDYLARYFWDAEFGGVFWMVDHLGRPVETKKRIYGQAFTVYALAEYYQASGDARALGRAFDLHRLIEKASHDDENGGYFETYERDWSLAQDQRLSEVDMDEKKSMNTHLHMMEAYASLLRAHPSAEKLGARVGHHDAHQDAGVGHQDVRQRLGELIEIFLEHIIDARTHHFILFFDERWTRRSKHVSFGHDIEGSWLLCEAAHIYGDAALLARVEAEAVRMAQTAFEEAVDADGGLMYEAEGTHIFDTDKHWWPQSEAVVGFLNAYQLTRQEHFLKASERSWQFIERHMIDHERGEWYWKVSRDGVVDETRYKVDPWKCPYHNSRTCFEVMERVDSLARAGKHARSVSGE